VFTALKEANVDSKDVSCLQRSSNGQVTLTFRRAQCKEQFLCTSVLKVGSTPYALQDVDRPLMYLQVYDTPHELPDLAIIHRLSQYCDVTHHCRGHFTQPDWEHVHDSVRHYRVRIKHPIWSFYDLIDATCSLVMLASHVLVVFADKQITWPLLVTPLPFSTARKPAIWLQTFPVPFIITSANHHHIVQAHVLFLGRAW